MFFKKKKDINDDILSQIKAKISSDTSGSSVEANDLLGSLMDTTDDVAVQGTTEAQAEASNGDIDMLNSMVEDAISKSNQEQAEIEDIAEDDILGDLLDNTANNAAPAVAETQTSQPTASDDDLLGNLLDDNPAPASSVSTVGAENTTSSNSPS